MPGWLLAVVTVNFLLQVAVSAARPLTSVRALGLGATSFELALLAAGYAFFALIAAVPVGRLIDRWGTRWFVVFGSLMLAAMVLLTAITDFVAGLIAIQTGIGLALLSANLGMQSTIAGRSGSQESAKAYGHYSTSAGIGLLVGPAIAGFLVDLTGGASAAQASPRPDPAATTVTFIVLGCVALAATAVALRIRPAASGRAGGVSAKAANRAGLLSTLLKRPGLLPVLTASAICVTSLDLLAIYIPAYGLDRGYTVSYIGVLLSIAAGGSIVARLLTGPATRILGRARLLMASLFAPAVGLALLPVLPGEFLPLDLAVVGLGLGFGQPTTMSWIASLAEPDQLAATLGVRVSGNRVGQLVIPVVVGAVIAATSLTVGFWAMAATLALTALLFAPPVARRLGAE